MNWPNSRKWRMTILLCLMTLFIGLATSAFSVGIDEMCAEFGVDSEVGQVGMFVVRPLHLGIVISPSLFEHRSMTSSTQLSPSRLSSPHPSLIRSAATLSICACDSCSAAFRDHGSQSRS